LEKHLHIICLNVPYPVNYGGVFDLFYKLPALKQLGVEIHLHCFEYGRGEQHELNRYCHSVHYYKRRSGLSALSLTQPYIVSSRNNTKLTETLLQDNYPILMEGTHCSYLVNDARFSNRELYVRLHNVEHIYYQHLFRLAKVGVKKAYYWWEYTMLKRYEKAVANKARYWAVANHDVEHLLALGAQHVSHLPLFLPQWKCNYSEGRGSYCLYQGDLSVEENEKSATWLLQNVFTDLEVPFVITGKNPSVKLEEMVHRNNNCCLVANPTEAEMQDMIAKAQIIVIPSYNTTGIKLKLVNALFNGRHCIVNEATVKGTGLEATCHIGTDAAAFKALISFLYKKPYTQQDAQIRSRLLSSMFNNETNARKIVNTFWGETEKVL
jgi:hypothetical protein